ncbi:MAG TPA: hypothetical protein VM580_23150 [Labilithrix sp.]|nr:hypothetical protein [Labilithrix sp.]
MMTSTENDNTEKNRDRIEGERPVRHLATAFVLGGLWIWSTHQARRSVDPFASAGKYRPAIYAFDVTMAKACFNDSWRSLAEPLGIRQMLLNQLKIYAAQGPSTARSVARMVADPRPMPVPTTWATPWEFKKSIQFGAFCCFANEKSVESLLFDLAPLTHDAASKVAHAVVHCRGTLLRACTAGTVTGLAISTTAMTCLPVSPIVVGLMVPVNGILIANAFADSIARLDRELQMAAPHSHDKVWNHIDMFIKRVGAATRRGPVYEATKFTLMFAVLGGSMKYARDRARDG